MADYLFSFSVEGAQGFAREIGCDGDADAIDFARRALLAHVAVHASGRAVVAVAKGTRLAGVALGKWTATGEEPVWESVDHL